MFINLIGCFTGINVELYDFRKAAYRAHDYFIKRTTTTVRWS